MSRVVQRVAEGTVCRACIDSFRNGRCSPGQLNPSAVRHRSSRTDDARQIVAEYDLSGQRIRRLGAALSAASQRAAVDVDFGQTACSGGTKGSPARRIGGSDNPANIYKALVIGFSRKLRIRQSPTVRPTGRCYRDGGIGNIIPAAVVQTVLKLEVLRTS
ncbi:hypothetical protein D3C81_1283020 [compost metagenome]